MDTYHVQQRASKRAQRQQKGITMEGIVLTAAQALSSALASLPIDSASNYGAVMLVIALAHVGALWFAMVRKR